MSPAAARPTPPMPFLESLAAEHLHIDTLETRRSDDLDFHDVAVWGVRAALVAAYEAGMRAGRDALLASDWMKRHDAEVRAEALREAADALIPFPSNDYGAFPWGAQSWLRDRAALTEEGEHRHAWERRQNVTTKGYALPPYEVCCTCGAARGVDQ